MATFGAQPFQHVGFGGTNPPFNDTPWIMFSTGNDAGQVYARVLPPGSSAYNTGNDKIPVGNYIGTPHTYRIDWKTDSIDFYVDGILKTTVSATISATMNVAVSDYQSAAPSLTVDWLRMSPPYASPCTFESRIFNAGEQVNWLDLTSTGSTPVETSVSFETRTGNTITPDGSWSGWEAVNSPIASPNGQYAQYRATLATTDSTQTPVIESVTLTYEEIPEYTLTYSAGSGGSITGTSPQTVAQGSDGTAVTAVPDPGYSFVKWSDNIATASRTDTNVTGDITVTASFTLNDYTITFDSAGGTAVASITLPYGSAVTAPADPTRAGYTFAGWTPAVPATMPLGGAALTAQWTANNYTITFDSNGGTAVASITLPYGSAVTAPADPTRAGYTFAGWTPAVPATMPLGGAALTAQWTANNYTVTFDANGGSTPVPTNKQVTFDSAYGTLATTSLTGYTFVGWFTAASGGTQVTAATIVSTASDHTLYAQWTTLPSHTVTFNANGGTGTMAPQVASLPTALNLNTFVRTGYSFAGWNTQSGGGGTSYADGAFYSFAADIILYAQWTAQPTYTVTYNGNGNTGGIAPTDSNTYLSGTTVTVLGNTGALVRTGYTFAGWNTAANGSGTNYNAGETFIMGSANVTLYAQWTAQWIVYLPLVYK